MENLYLKSKIYKIDISNPYYPQILKNIYDPPKTLYVKGNVQILNDDAIAIIGCRDASIYGKKACKYFSYNLAKKQINIISGLARGIDSFAHMGAIEAKGKTIAIIGCGLDIVYPKENDFLYNKIIETGGAIVSEYDLGTLPKKMNFPQRNRIISGMSKGVIVIEAKKQSGSLITVDFALDQGREVYAVPGNINAINSTGTNELIKQGAKLITCYEDVDFIHKSLNNNDFITE